MGLYNYIYPLVMTNIANWKPWFHRLQVSGTSVAAHPPAPTAGWSATDPPWRWWGTSIAPPSPRRTSENGGKGWQGLVKPQENHRKTIGKPQENGDIMGKPQENPQENGGFMGFYGIYPLVMTNIAMVFLWPIEIDALPVNSMVIFHGYVKSPDGSSFGIIIYQSNTKYIYIHIYIYIYISLWFIWRFCGITSSSRNW